MGCETCVVRARLKSGSIKDGWNGGNFVVKLTPNPETREASGDILAYTIKKKGSTDNKTNHTWVLNHLPVGLSPINCTE